MVSYYDPLNVDALVQRYPLPGASNADKAAAAQHFHRRGYETDWIATVLRAKRNTVDKWLHRDVRPIPEDGIIPAPPPADKCRNGHPRTPDNIGSQNRCKTCSRERSRNARAKRRKETQANPQEVRTHGPYAYRELGCRCDTCKAAVREQSRRHRARKRAATKESA